MVTSSKKQSPRGLDTYTKTTMIQGEKIVFAARLHKFSRYWGIFLLLCGSVLLAPEFYMQQWEKSGIKTPSLESDASETPNADAAHSDTRKQATAYVNKAVGYWYAFTDRLSPSLKDMLSKAMDTRRRLVGFLVTILGAYTLTMSILRKYTTEHVITTYKVLKKKGLISVQANEVPLKQIEGARVKQSILDRFLNRGTVLITGVGMERIEARHINDPETFRKKINEAVHRYT